MRKLPVLLFFLMFAGALYAQRFTSGGMLVGLTASQIDGDNYRGYGKVGLQGGGWVRTMFTYRVGGQMEIRYIQKGALKRNTVDDPTYHKTALHNIDIPLMAQYIYNENLVMELGIGPEILIYVKQEDENGELPIPDPQYNRFTISAIAGLGYHFLDVFYAHFRFSYSILPIRPHPSGQTFLLNKGHYSNVLSIALYYQIGKN